MDRAPPIQLYITHVEKDGPFFKVWGQSNKVTALYIEQLLLGATPQFEQHIGVVDYGDLHPNTLICAKYKDNKYYRARILNRKSAFDGTVEVIFIDFGNRDVVHCANIRSLQLLPTSFISTPPLAHSYLLGEVANGNWDCPQFISIATDIKYTEVTCLLIAQICNTSIVKLYNNAVDIGAYFINKGLLEHMPLPIQQSVLLEMHRQREMSSYQANVQVAPSTKSSGVEINTYKTHTLEPGNCYQVYVSYVNDGPCHFSVQLRESEPAIVKLMKEINALKLKAFEEVPFPGTICLARSEEDGNVCRAVITNEVDTQFKVYFVDFGNYEVVSLDSMYQIPFNYVLPKVMAIRFALDGIEKPAITMEMQCAFKKFVDDRLLHMKVLPSNQKIVNKCELWDPKSKVSALDVVLGADVKDYPEPITLTRGCVQPVKVSYIYSCSRFYVQLSSKESELQKLMEELQETCKVSSPLDPRFLKIGMPCCALFEGDQQWYRSQIVQLVDDVSVKVRYVDFGNEEVVSMALLRRLQGEHLAVLRPQAIECILNGYQHVEVDVDRDNFLEQLILEQEFTMKVVELSGKKAVVTLVDKMSNNVASILLEQVAVATDQPSPRMMPRKSFSPPQNNGYNSNREKEMPVKHWKERGAGDNGWRDNKPIRNNDKVASDSTESNTWRNNNKGFNRNNQWNNQKDSGTSDMNWNSSGSNSQRTSAEWNTPENNGAGPNRSPRNPPTGNYKKREFGRENSEVSSSGSEVSLKKGPRTSSRNDRVSNKPRYDKPKNASFNTTASGVNDSWSVSAVTPQFDLAHNTDTFARLAVIGSQRQVLISWFHNPTDFYCQLYDTQDNFKQMMDEIQEAYKGRASENSVEGAPIVALFVEDNVLYRAKVLQKVNAGTYKVHFIDFGNVAVASKVWGIEKKFMSLPAQAIRCGLAGIKPINQQEHWPDPDLYGKYFEKESFVCNFVEAIGDMTMVDLLDRNVDVKRLLLADNLAESTSAPVSAPVSASTSAIAPSTKEEVDDIDYNLIVGQQFSAMLFSINSLSDFSIHLQNGTPFACKMHNLEAATETFEPVLKAQLHEFLVVYVDSVVEANKLEVTLYDKAGTKLEILKPDEGAFDFVEPLSNYLLLRSEIHGFVSHVTENTICLQPSDEAGNIGVMLDTLFSYYDEPTAGVDFQPEVGMVCAARGLDTNWYRARIIDLTDQDVEVCYIDYGNTERLALDALRELNLEFKQMSEFCLAIAVDGATDVYLEKEVTVKVAYNEIGLFGQVTIEEQPPGEVPVQEAINQEVLSEEVVTQELPTEEIVNEAPATEELPPQIGTAVILSHIDSPSDFYLQFAENTDAINELQVNLQAEIENMPVLENASTGILCAAPYSADQLWYRAQVLDADAEITTVRFVDFGNTDVISNETTQIKTLPASLLSLDIYTTRSSLKIKPVNEEWTQTDLERFIELISGDVTTATFLGQDEKTNYVDLFVDGRDVKQVLIDEKLALPDDLAVESKSTCFVSHLNSPSEFWIQLENCVEELEWIAEQLTNAASFPELQELAPGTLCAALFPDDEMWYRARILSNTVAGIELLFIDYGNSCVANNLRQLPEDLLVTQPLAQKCSLQGAGWNELAVQRFCDISADGQTVFMMKKVSTGETAVVQLMVGGVDVVEMLVPVTEKGWLKNFESLDCFGLVEVEGVFKLELVHGLEEWSAEAGEAFKEIWKNGETQFDVEMVGDGIVRLFLDGKDIRYDLLSADKTAVMKLDSTVALEEDSEDVVVVHDKINHDDRMVPAIASRVPLDTSPSLENGIKEDKDQSSVSNEAHGDDTSDNSRKTEEFDQVLNGSAQCEEIIDQIMEATLDHSNEELKVNSEHESSFNSSNDVEELKSDSTVDEKQNALVENAVGIEFSTVVQVHVDESEESQLETGSLVEDVVVEKEVVEEEKGIDLSVEEEKVDTLSVEEVKDEVKTDVAVNETEQFLANEVSECVNQALSGVEQSEEAAKLDK